MIDNPEKPSPSPKPKSSGQHSQYESTDSSSRITTSDSNVAPDLEKADTVPESNELGVVTGVDAARVSRLEALTRRNTSRVQDLSRVNTRNGTFTHPLSHVKTTADTVVEFDGIDDPYRPLNWPFRKKAVTTLLYGFTTMGATFASSVYSPVVDQLSQQYHVGTEVTLLGLSLLLIGFGLGPLLWAPLSEVYGRKPAVLVPYFLAAVFSFGTATAKDIQTILITRFFTGLFGSAPVTNTGGVLGDIWAPAQRGTAIVFYAFAVVGGPVLGPIVGGAVVQSYLRWRWTEYVKYPNPVPTS